MVKILKIYSWKDIERICLMKKSLWENKITIEIYPNEINIFNNKEEFREKALDLFYSLIENLVKIDRKNNIIITDLNEKIEVLICPDIYLSKKTISPVFCQAIYNKPNQDNLPKLACPVLAFYSDKEDIFIEDNVLLVNTNLTNPSIFNKDINFSYLDLLDLLMNIEENEYKEDKIINIATELIKDNVLPAYRYEEQLFDKYATPYTIAECYHNKYAIQEILAKIAIKLNLNGVLLDLTTGISEDAAPFLLDKRIKLISSIDNPILKKFLTT